MTEYTEKHKQFLKKLGFTLDQLVALSPEDGEKFIIEKLVPYISGKGTAEEEEIADDIIDVMHGECIDSIETKEQKPQLIRTVHHNLYAHGENEPIDSNDDFDFAIYCRRENGILNPNDDLCLDCPFLTGSEMGHGVECTWDDVKSGEVVDTRNGIIEVVVRHDRVTEEYERVDTLIKNGVLEDYSMTKPVLNTQEVFDEPCTADLRTTVSLAMSEEQAKDKSVCFFDFPVCPNSLRTMEKLYFNMQKIPEHLCIRKEIGWERTICAYKKDFDEILRYLYEGIDYDYSDIKNLLNRIQGDKFWIYGFGD